MKKKEILVIGCGYVGMSLAMTFANKHNVIICDIDQNRVNLVNQRISPIQDDYISEMLSSENLSLRATDNAEQYYSTSDYIFLALPTDFDYSLNYFDTSILRSCIKNISSKTKNKKIIIKSTVPIGFTESMIEEFQNDNILFCPEFLREGRSLLDSLNPSRIIIGSSQDSAIDVGNLIKSSVSKENVQTIYMHPTEAEAVKLFSNTYLAMRVSFFNELDSFALTKGLDALKIIQGISLDDRIGNFYNNPSFGFGGYCLPKDTRQLIQQLADFEAPLISSIIDSNEKRKELIINHISSISPKPKIIGIYNLAMKAGSDNIRSSSIIDIINGLVKLNFNILIFDSFIKQLPTILTNACINLTKDFDYFTDNADIIVTNRQDDIIRQFNKPVISRDLFNID